MMDATAMYPHGFHPVMEHHLPDDVTTFAPVLPRSSVLVTYYFVDFGISTQFDPEDTNRFVTAADGLDREPPELSDDIPYNPFKLDIFIIANTISLTFVMVSTLHNDSYIRSIH